MTTFQPTPAKIQGPRVVRFEPLRPGEVDVIDAGIDEAERLDPGFYWTASVWDENLDYWTDENGEERSAPDGPPSWVVQSYHHSKAGAVEAAVALKRKGIDAEVIAEFKPEWDNSPILP